MTSAVEDLSYRGTFVHLLGDEVETLQIIHRNDDGRISERIVSMDGVGREIIRNEDEIYCILPDRQIVLFDNRREVSPLVSSLPSYSEDDLARSYEIALLHTERVVERDAQVVAIHPRDEFRYGYRLWLDSDTAMPLKSQLRDGQGRTVEQMAFTQIDIGGEIPPSALEPTIDAQGFEVIMPPDNAVAESASQWRATRLPDGFQLSVATLTRMAGSENPVEHLVYSDGLATVSVFVESPDSETEVAGGLSRIGSTNAFSFEFSGRQITAVGEVPAVTVESIATSFASP